MFASSLERSYGLTNTLFKRVLDCVILCSFTILCCFRIINDDDDDDDYVA